MAPPEEIPPPKADFSAPPPYELNDTTSPSGKLPTYEEVQMEKTLHGELPINMAGQMPPPPPIGNTIRHNTGQNGHGGPALTFIAIDAADADNMTDNSLLGTDIMFITSFVVAFLFNIIGLIILRCYCHTFDSRYGALSGLGVSFFTWTLIVQHIRDLEQHENS